MTADRLAILLGPGVGRIAGVLVLGDGDADEQRLRRLAEIIQQPGRDADDRQDQGDDGKALAAARLPGARRDRPGLGIAAAPGMLPLSVVAHGYPSESPGTAVPGC